MPSKGVQVYFYSAVQGCRAEFEVPGKTITRDQFRSWSNDHLEVDKDQLGALKFEGRVCFRVFGPRGAELTNQWFDVNVATGGLGDGSMAKIEQMHTVSKNGFLVSYGLYDAGSGQFGLPDSHQVHVTVGPDHSDWMGQIVPRDSKEADQKASCFALPCAHDPGMSTMQNVDSILNSGAAAAFSKMLSDSLHVKLNLDAFVNAVMPTQHIREIVYALSVTQKDDIRTMLELGARYFEFRPGKLPSDAGLPDEFFFLHLVIPGLAYNELLEVFLDFLGSHPDEIVVVQLRHDGIPDFIPKFDDATMDGVATEAVKRKNNGVQVGNLGDLNDKTIRQLRETNQRLLITKQDHVSQYSSYDDAANATLVPGPIVEKFDAMSADEQNKTKPTFTVLQCQATATNIKPVLEYSIATSEASTSVMMATKAICDVGTHPWIEQNGDKFAPEHLLIIMNDFIEAATCDIAIELSRKRFAKLG